MTTFFTADSHIGHDRVRELCHRPHPSIDAMNLDLLTRWNAVVNPTDEVWHLGDVFFHGAELFFDRLHGRKHLVIGNHDGPKTLKLPWLSSQHYKELKLDGTRIVLCHYPFVEWNRSRRGALHFHGHTHGTLADTLGRWDVGVDRWDFTPVTLAQIRARSIEA
jgi:calcineurin-like phosphoesterase family protein